MAFNHLKWGVQAHCWLIEVLFKAQLAVSMTILVFALCLDDTTFLHLDDGLCDSGSKPVLERHMNSLGAKSLRVMTVVAWLVF